MREIISIDKDFLNNKETITTKQKPESRARGKVTVSLFDEKGNKQREIKTENIVYDWVKAYSFKNTYLTNFGLGTMGAVNSASICTGSQTGMLPLSKYLMLFNGDHEDTNPRKSLIKDTLVGYAGRHENYSGSDILKGTYNSVESKTSIDKEGNIVFHMVYDFPTHAANGNITGIGLGHTTSRNAELLPNKVYYRNSTNSSSSSYGVTKFNNAITCNSDNNMLLGVLTCPSTTQNYEIGVTERSIGNRISMGTIPSSYKSISKTPNSLNSQLTYYGYMGLDEETDNVLISYNTSSVIHTGKTNGNSKPPLNAGSEVPFYVRKIDNKENTVDISGVLNFDFNSLFGGLKETVTTTSSGSVGIYLSSLLLKDKIVCYVKTYESGSNYLVNSPNPNGAYLFMFDINGNYEKHEEITSHYNSRDCKLIPYGQDEFLLPVGNGKIIKCNLSLSDLSVVDLASLNINNKDNIDLSQFNSLTSYDFVGNYNKKSLYILDVANSYETRYKLKDDRINLSSYTRLPSPVVKTNIHTMKVQYDLVIEDVSVYDYIEY